MTIEHKYKKLDEIDHALQRSSRYIGSTSPHTSEVFVIRDNRFVKEEITYCPAFIKIFDEIITNSVDFSKTSEGKHLDTIKVSINRQTGQISVFDNGGIVVKLHKEHNQYIPEMIFELRAGSNFNDDDDSGFVGGTHGEGAALTNIFSSEFKVNTADGNLEFVQVHTNNSRNKSEPFIRKSNKRFTEITYQPELHRFGITEIDDGNFKKLVKRVYDIAGCNPRLKVFLNEQQIQIKSFEDYIKLYLDDYTYDENDNWRIGVSKSDGSFSHVSFVNGIETHIGGNHVNYIADQLVSKLREYITKKHKIEVKPSEIKNHLNLFIDCNIVKPKYSSQTKDEMTTEIRNFGTSFTVSDKFVQRIIKSSIVQSILDWAEAKAAALEKAELRKLNKSVDKFNPSRIPKFEDCSEKRDRSKCIIFFTEGESAKSSIMSARDPRYHAVFPLKGKPLNVTDIDPKKLMDNEEFKNILTITGLKLGESVNSVNDIRFGKICFLTDADCLTKDHYVLTSDGEKLIDDVEVDDEVLTHEDTYRKVVAVNKKFASKILSFRSYAGYTNEIGMNWHSPLLNCIETHQVIVNRNGLEIIIEAKDVKIGDKFKYINGIDTNELVEIDEIEVIELETPELVIDLTVEDHHTFYAKHVDSDKFVLTHNCDGTHIQGLLMNMLFTYWPELFTLGVVNKFKTPLLKVFLGKEVLEFYDNNEYEQWVSKNKTKKFTTKYFKGLGTSTSKDFKGYLENIDKNMVQYEIEDSTDSDYIKLAFSKNSDSADLRKKWLGLEG